MSCEHAEDVCQHCLEKVQTSTEDAPPPKRVIPPEKTMIASVKRNKVLFDSSLLAVIGAMAYLNGKLFFKMAATVFDSILDTIGTRTDKE